MSLVGGWQPKKGLLAKYLKNIYPIYSIFVIFTFYFITILEIIRINQAKKNFAEFNEILFILLISMLISNKITFHVLNQNKIRALGNQLLNPSYFPCNEYERTVKNKYEKINR